MKGLNELGRDNRKKEKKKSMNWKKSKKKKKKMDKKIDDLNRVIDRQEQYPRRMK